MIQKNIVVLVQRQNNMAQGVVRLETRMDHVDDDIKELKIEMKDLSTEFKNHLKQYH